MASTITTFSLETRWASPLLYSIWREALSAALSHGKWSQLKFLEATQVQWSSSSSHRTSGGKWEVAGWANWAMTLNSETWDCFSPSQSSVVSQLTSRGTWRHLVPVRMTVTVEGRGSDGSPTTDGSSWTGEATSESWLYTLTAEGKVAIGGPVDKVSCQ